MATNLTIVQPVTLDTTLTAYKIPLSAIALWPTPNFINPERRFGLAPYAFCLEIFTTITLGARIYARLTGKAGQFGADDVIIVGAWIFGTAFTALNIYGVTETGFDRHVWDVPFSLVAAGGFVAWASESLFLISSSLTKISILLFYRRLVDRSYSKNMQKIIYVAIAFTIVYLGTFLLFLIFACQPVNAAWKSLDISFTKPYKCADRRYVDPFVGVLSVFSDLYALIIPNIVVYRLKMQRTKKIVLFCIFGAGLIVVGAGLARTVWLSRLYTDQRRDLTWIGYEILIWTELEMHGAIICASAPALKGFFSSYFSGLDSTRYGSTKAGLSAFDSLAGEKGTVNLQSRDWPLAAPKQIQSGLTQPSRQDQDGPYGGITVTERYSVTSLPTMFARAEQKLPQKKGRRVLGV